MKKTTANTALAAQAAKEVEVFYGQELSLNQPIQPEALETLEETAAAFTAARLLRPLVVTATGSRPDGKYVSLPYGTVVGYLKEYEDSNTRFVAEVGLARLVKAGFVERDAEKVVLKPTLGWESVNGAVELLGSRLADLALSSNRL